VKYTPILVDPRWGESSPNFYKMKIFGWGLTISKFKVSSSTTNFNTSTIFMKPQPKSIGYWSTKLIKKLSKRKRKRNYRAVPKKRKEEKRISWATTKGDGRERSKNFYPRKKKSYKIRRLLTHCVFRTLNQRSSLNTH